jgi:CubicO group peptidase (beta-lactamase class C family)
MKASMVLRRFVAPIALAIAAATVTSAQQPSIFSPGGTLPVLDQYLEALRQQAGIPGMSAAVVSDGAVIWEKGYGFQNLVTRERATPDTPYLVGDASGTLAAVLLLQCVEIRRMGLDDPISRYGLSSPEPEATLRGLLSHAPPAGAKDPFFYSPERYAHLTALMEWCAPQPYRKSVSHRLLNHLAMRDSVPGTDLADPNLALPEGLYAQDELERYRAVLQRMAVPYKTTGRNKAERTELAPAPMTAAGGLVSTVRDLAKLDGAIDTGLLLQPETLAAAWSPAAGRNGNATPMGLGWFVQTYRGERIVWHFGSVPNAYSSLILKLPQRNVTFILLANSDGLSAPFQLPAGDITRSLFASLFLRLVL